MLVTDFKRLVICGIYSNQRNLIAEVSQDVCYVRKRIWFSCNITSTLASKKLNTFHQMEDFVRIKVFIYVYFSFPGE